MSTGIELSGNLLSEVLAKYPRWKRCVDGLIATVPLSMRLSRNFWKWYALLIDSESWSRGELEEFQLRLLKQLLSKVSAESEFYKLRLAGVRTDKIDSLESFQKLLPLLTRDEFRSNYDRIKSSTIDQKRVAPFSTSGTTGNALQFLHSAEDSDREWASICYQWRRVGYEPGRSRRAEFRGLTKSGLVDRFPKENMIRCSILDLKRDHLRHYAEAIQREGIEFFHGYPSALYLLSKEVNTNGAKFPQPKAILLASESVYEFQLREIQSAFPTSKLYAHYGCAERTVLAGWCEKIREYHVLPQYAFVEVDNTTGQIIGTNLFNSVNAFIRYAMTDTVLHHTLEPCPACRRPYMRLIQLGGRSEDYLFSPERGWIPPAIVTYPLKCLRAIYEIQFLQEEPNTIHLRYTVSEQHKEFVENERQRVNEGLNKLLGTGIRFVWEQVAEFSRGPTGKFKWIVSKLDEQPLDRSESSLTSQV